MAFSPKKITINVNVREDTNTRIEKIASLTFRSKGEVIDWLISQYADNQTTSQLESITQHQDSPNTF